MTLTKSMVVMRLCTLSLECRHADTPLHRARLLRETQTACALLELTIQDTSEVETFFGLRRFNQEAIDRIYTAFDPLR